MTGNAVSLDEVRKAKNPEEDRTTDEEKVLEDVIEKVRPLIRRIVQNVGDTGEKSTLTITVEASYNKEDELVISTGGKCVLPLEKTEQKGEILAGQLRLW
jgi:hypothetical protein